MTICINPENDSKKVNTKNESESPKKEDKNCNDNTCSKSSTDESYQKKEKTCDLKIEEQRTRLYQNNTEVYKTNEQVIYLLNQGKTCPKQHPRTLLFLDPTRKSFAKYLKEEQFKGYKIDKMVLKDKQDFIVGYKGFVQRTMYNVVKNSMILSKELSDDYNLYMPAGFGLIDTKKKPKYNKYQKRKYYPAIPTLKKNLYVNYKKMRKIFPKDYNYMLETYIYPEEKKIIQKKFENYEFSGKDLWFVKPDFGNSGTNMYSLKQWKI